MKPLPWWSRPLDRRLAVVTIPPVLLAAVYALALLYPAWQWALSQRERLADARFEEGRAQQTLEAARLLPMAVVGANEQWLKQQLNPGQSEAEAREALLHRVRAQLAAMGVERLSLNPLPSQRVSDRYYLLNVQLVGELAERDALGLIASLEAVRPRLKISKWSMRSLGRWRSGKDPGVQLSLVASAPWQVPDPAAQRSKGGRP